MSFNRSPLAFDDIRELLDRAIAAPKGIRLTLASHGAAMELRSRMNYFRKIDRRQNAEIYEKGHPQHGVSPYDRLVMRVGKKGSEEELIVSVEKHSTEELKIEEIT